MADDQQREVVARAIWEASYPNNMSWGVLVRKATDNPTAYEPKMVAEVRRVAEAVLSALTPKCKARWDWPAEATKMHFANDRDHYCTRQSGHGGSHRCACGSEPISAEQPDPLRAGVDELLWQLDHMDDGARIVFASGIETPLSVVRDRLRALLPNPNPETKEGE